jgi:hypothetical protein
MPAVSGIPAIAASMQFNWSADDTQEPIPTIKNGRRFIFQPDTDGNYVIKLAPQIDFAVPNRLGLEEIPFSLESLPFERFVKANIMPVNFLVMTGESQVLRYLYEYLLGIDKDYRISLQDVVWSQPSGEIGNGQEFLFSTSKPAVFKLVGNGLFRVQERFEEPPPVTDFSIKRECHAEILPPPIINLTAYDLEHKQSPVPDNLEETLGALIHFNIDNDNRNVSSGDIIDGEPLTDFMEADYVLGEDDLVNLSIELSYLPRSGNIALWRDDEDNLKVWSSPTKEATSSILIIEKEKVWNLADATQRDEFIKVKNNLWVEGCASGASGLTAVYQKKLRNISTDRIAYKTFFSPYGRQPTNLEHRLIHDGMSLGNIVDCEWSITGEASKKYNCIAWSVGEDNVFYNNIASNYAANVIGIDEEFGDNDHKFENEDIIAFYAAKGFEQLNTDSPWEADVIYFSEFHAAKRVSVVNGKYTFFESKLGNEIRIAHVWNQIICEAYGKPHLLFKRKEQ